MFAQFEYKGNWAKYFFFTKYLFIQDRPNELTSLLCKCLSNAIKTCNLAAMHFSCIHIVRRLQILQYKWNKEPNILNKNFIYFRLLVQLVVTKKPPNLNRFTIHILNMYVVNLRWTFHRETIDFISFIASIEWIRPLCKKLKLMQTIQLKKYYRINWKKENMRKNRYIEEVVYRSLNFVLAKQICRRPCT